VIGFGKDQWCAASLVTGRYATGWLIVAQACYRRLITPVGMLRWGEEESRYGLDVAGFIGAVGDEAALVALPVLVAAELSKDDRVADVLCIATSTTDSAGMVTITLSIDVELKDEGGNFNLTMTVADAKTSLVSVREAA
jgi:hypothetical protein